MSPNRSISVRREVFLLGFLIISLQNNVFCQNFLTSNYLYRMNYGLPALESSITNTIIDHHEITNDNELESFRLPNNSKPLYYDLSITTKVHEGEKHFSGTVLIDIVILEDTSTIIMHAKSLEIKNVRINEHQPQTKNGEKMNFQFDKERDFLILERMNGNKPFERDSNWSILIEYTGELRLDNEGFYLSKYIDDENNVHYLGATQFESIGARYAFPCYDEPSKRATFKVSIVHSAGYDVISNMPQESRKVIDNDFMKTTFKPTVSMPTYLLAFIVSDFCNSEGYLNGYKQRIFSRPGTDHQQEWALISGMLILQRLSEYFRVPFVLPKIDQAALPDFAAGAMENWGLATYQEEFLLYDPDHSSVYTQTNVAHIIGHEYTHQWFGNLVGIQWWSYLWLKEGFATLYSYKAVDDAYPEWGIWQQFHVSDYQMALEVDASRLSRPLTYHVERSHEIRAQYDGISYSKGAAVLDMWNHGLPTGVFRHGLTKYLQDNKFKSAVEDDLFDALQIAIKELNIPLLATVKEMFSTWTHQSGYPLLIVTRNYENRTMDIIQTSYIPEEGISKSWYIPLNYAIEDIEGFQETTASHYLTNTNEGIEIHDINLKEDKWLILNKQSTGFYRIQYDEKNWKLIIAGLKRAPHRIHPRNRAQILNDAFNLCFRGQLKHEILLELMSYVANGGEDQFAPWSTLQSIIKLLRKYLQGEEDDYAQFKRYVMYLVGRQYEQFGVQDIKDEHHYRKYTRNLIIEMACSADYEHCLMETQKKLLDSIENGKPVEVNLLNSIYCSALRYAKDPEYNYVLDELRNNDNQAMRRLLISVLSCSQSQDQLGRFLANILDDSEENRLRIQEKVTILATVYMQGDHGLLAAITFLDRHWEKYAQLNGGVADFNLLDIALQQMSSYVMNEDQEQRLLELLEKVKKDSEFVGDSTENLIMQNIQFNKDWFKMHRDHLVNWIKAYNVAMAADSQSLTVWIVAGTVIPLTVLVTIGTVLFKYRKTRELDIDVE